MPKIFKFNPEFLPKKIRTANEMSHRNFSFFFFFGLKLVLKET